MGGPGRQSDPQAALLRPGFLRDGSRVVLAAGVADGLSARGDPQARRFRGVRDPRRVDHRGAGGQRNRAGVPQCMPPSRGQAGGRQRKSAHLRLPIPRLVLGHRRPQQLCVATRGVRRGEHAPGRSATRLGQVRALGRMRLDQPRRQRPAVARLPGAVRVDLRRLEGGIAARRMVAVMPAAGELEAGDCGVHGGLPRPADPSAAAAVSADRQPVGSGAPRRREQPLLHADPGRRHGRHDPRERHPHRRGPADTSSCPPIRPRR